MIASTTQIEPKGVMGTLRLLFHIWHVRKQLARCPGLIAYDFHSPWRTLTLWENRDALKAFRNSGAHLAAMKATSRIGLAKTVTWEVSNRPTWPEVIQKLDAPRPRRMQQA